MANRALYRKYRPRTFAEVIGQEHVTAPLIQALKNGKLNHAYLFSGPRGCGKTSSARILARSLNCVNGPTPDPCGVCDSCVALAPDGPGSLDVVEIDAASHGGVDDARDLRERAFFAPVNSRFKVYVIDEAHMVSSQGFNALLKLVEEPPDFVKFVFATTEPDKVLQTIRSRTHHYPFRLIPPSTMVGLLDRICTDESVTIEQSVLPLVVRAGGGSARDSLSILDQLLAGAGDGGVTYQNAVALLGVTDSTLLDEACSALAADDGAALYGVVDRVVDAGHDPRRFASDLLERLRDLVILATVPDAAAKGLVDAPADQLERMTLVANQLGVATASRMADVVHNGLVEMRGTTSPRLLLELVCARMLLPAADESQAALLQRLERLERRLAIAGEGTLPAAPPAPVQPQGRTPGESAPQARAPEQAAGAPEPAAPQARAPEPAAPAAEPPRPTPPPVTPPRPAAETSAPSRPTPDAGTPSRPAAPVVPAQTPAPVSRPAPAATAPPTPPAAGGMDAAAVRQVWPQIVDQTKQRSRMVWALVQNATPREVNGDELVLAVKHQGEVRRLSDDKCVSVLQEVLQTVLGVRWKIRAEADGAPSGRGGGGGTGRRGPAPPQAPAPAPPAPPGGGGDWPTIAPVGGLPSAPASAPSVAPTSPAPANHAQPSAAPVSPAAVSPAPVSPAPAGTGLGSTTHGAPAPRSGGSAPAMVEDDDVPLPPEPPSDPMYDGFDPGDEPLDDEDEASAGRPIDSEADAIALLEQHLGARQID
ncbi:DNA polymerase III subunit gamma and tau [Cryptosporangium aurantiacum]|uniref:DNA polymerase III subunit gamma/tau n=1 Tax=Cryptosporangium aurantiacum TaxID=134849 RepID=A0A1M7NMM2_9ACTN|nr:DNA polymerase III subunit gamma and tau [Cryptosporangium aurantiacum]SHN04750.1 DNA polymerase III, tau subunit [Cryptosporangium aurantiacum]